MEYIIIICAVVIIIILLSYFVFKKVFYVRKRRKYFDEEYLRARFKVNDYENAINWLEKQEIEDVSITSFDGLKLCARYIKRKPSNNKIVILVHGYRSNSNRMLELAKMYYEKFNCDVLLIDLRAHGLSEGKYIGMGTVDSKDLIGWINYLNLKGNSQIILHGFSMGAATIMSISDLNLKNLSLIVEDCGFASAKEELFYKMKQEVFIPAWILYPLVSLFCKIKIGFYLKECDPIDHVKNSIYPMLFIHGNDDTFVPVKFAYELYNVCPSPKDILIVDKAAHTLAYRVNSKAYEEKISDSINKYLKN